MSFQRKTSVLLLSLLVTALALTACSGGATLSQAQAATAAAATVEAMFPTATAAPLIITATPAPTEMTVATATQLPAAPTATAASANAAVRINFASGATFGIAQGNLQPGASQTFVLNGSKGQPFIISVNALNNDLYFSVTGKNGTVLLPAASRLSSWETELPTSQDYLVQVFAGTTDENFTLSVEMPSRISFASGAVSATVKGATVSGYQVSYVLNARKDQTMTVTLNAPANSAALTVYGYTDGQPYQRSVTGSTTFSMKLPSTQDYIVQVVPNASAVVQYSLTVVVK